MCIYQWEYSTSSERYSSEINQITPKLYNWVTIKEFELINWSKWANLINKQRK